jgi:hypothetical protein
MTNIEMLRSLGLLQENPIKQEDAPILGGSALTGPLGSGMTAGSSALKLAPSLAQATTQAGTSLGTKIAAGAGAALAAGSQIIPSLLPSQTGTGDSTATTNRPTNPFGIGGPSTVQAGLDALNAVKTPTPSFTQAREGGSPSLPSMSISPPPVQSAPSQLSPIPTSPAASDTSLPPLQKPRPVGVGRLDILDAESPRSTPAPTPPSMNFTPLPGFINTTTERPPAPPVSNTVDESNPWYIAPEELAQAMQNVTAQDIAQDFVTDRPGERTTIDNNLPPTPAPILQTAPKPTGTGQLDIPDTPAPTPAPVQTPPPTIAPTPEIAPKTEPGTTPGTSPGTGTAPGVSASTGTGASPGVGTTPGTGATPGTGTGTGSTTPPPTTSPPTVVPPVTPPTADTTPTGNTPDPVVVTPPGNQGAAQNLIPTPPPVPAVTANQVSVSNFTPPTANSIQERAPLPTVAQAPQLNLGESLGTRNTQLPTLPTSTSPNLGAMLGGVPQTNLPTIPTREVGNFQDFLAQNATGQMSQEEIAAQARRMAEMQINPELAQAEQDRLAAQQRFQLALSQVGLGKEEALADLRSGFDDRLRQIQAMAIRNGLTSSNIPLEQDINPLMQDFTMRQRTMEQGIQNEINRLQLEASLGDQDAGRRIQTLLGQLGLIESNANFDLSRDERNFGEQARQNRFGEFMGGEQLQRQTAQDTFGNQADLASMTEALRGNRLNEGLAQAGLDRQARQDQFGNEAQLAEMTEALRQNQLNELLAQVGFNRDSGQQDFANAMARAGMTEQQRQSDIGNNRADRSQGFQEFLGSQGLGLDLARLNESLLQGGLDRALRQDELNNRPVDNALRQQLGGAQVQEALARAAQAQAIADNGGLDPTDAFLMTKELGRDATGFIQTIMDPTKPQQQKDLAKAQLADVEAEYDRIRGPGAFQRRYGSILQKALNPPPSGPSFWDRLIGSIPPIPPTTQLPPR